MEKNMIVKTNLSVIEYIMLVDAIANGYFGDAGEYLPHIGMINCMRVFYNLCVEDSKFENEIPHDFTDLLMVDKLAADDEFLEAFNKAIAYHSDGGARKLDFCGAYMDAREIVQTRNNPIEKFSKNALAFINSAVETLTNVLSEENINKIGEFAEQVEKGNLDYYKLMEEFKNSDVFNKTTKDGNAQAQITPFPTGEAD